MSDGTLEFDLAIDAAAEKFGLSAERAMQTICLDAFERVIRRTPVGDPEYWVGHPKGNPPGDATPPPGYVGGNARNNWWLSINKDVESPSGRTANASEQNEAYAEMTAGVLQSKLGDRIVLQNGVPYIMGLEAGTGSPRQAPNGMVALTFAEMQQHFSKIMEKELGK